MILLMCSMIVACISFTVSKMMIFNRLRQLLDWRILHCPYCISFWIAIPFAFALMFYEAQGLPIHIQIFSFLFYEFLLVWLAAFQYSILAILLKKAGLW